MAISLSGKTTAPHKRPLLNRMLVCAFFSITLLAFPHPSQADGDSAPPIPATEEALSHVPNPLAKNVEPPKPDTPPGIYTRPETEGAASFTRGESINFYSFRKWAGMDSLVRIPLTYICRTDDDWKKLWMMKSEEEPPMKHLPQGTMAVAVFLGDRPNEYYSVNFKSIRRDQNTDSLFITYSEYKPRYERIENKNTTPTSPWVIYLIPNAQGQIRFRKETQIR